MPSKRILNDLHCYMLRDYVSNHLPRWPIDGVLRPKSDGGSVWERDRLPLQLLCFHSLYFFAWRFRCWRGVTTIGLPFMDNGSHKFLFGLRIRKINTRLGRSRPAPITSSCWGSLCVYGVIYCIFSFVPPVQALLCIFMVAFIVALALVVVVQFNFFYVAHTTIVIREPL